MDLDEQSKQPLHDKTSTESGFYHTGYNALSASRVEKLKMNKHILRLRKTITFISIFLLSFIVGLNNTSFGMIAKTSLNQYSSEWADPELLQKISPMFYLLGGLIGSLVLNIMKHHDFSIILKVSTVLGLVAYILTISYPHILMLYATRVFLGLSNSGLCLIIPQLLHSYGPKNGKSFYYSIYPFFLLFGVTVGIGLSEFDNLTSYVLPNCIPIVLYVFALGLLFFTLPLKKETRDLSTMNFINLMSNSATLISFYSIILLTVIAKLTGWDYFMLNSKEIFGDENIWKRLLPFFVAKVCTLFGGFLPDKMGRKISFSTGILGLAIMYFIFYFLNINIWTGSIFVFIYFCCVNNIPGLYLNEIVPSDYQNMANVVGNISNWILSGIVYIFLVFLVGKSKQTAFLIWQSWLSFFLLSFAFI